ncbi:5385_t:CDS:2, partial [Rhizophagus irregularis]
EVKNKHQHIKVLDFLAYDLNNYQVAIKHAASIFLANLTIKFLKPLLKNSRQHPSFTVALDSTYEIH